MNGTESRKKLRDRIELQDAEIERLRGEIKWLRGELHVVERLRAALKEITELGDVRADEASLIAKRALEQPSRPISGWPPGENPEQERS